MSDVPESAAEGTQPAAATDASTPPAGVASPAGPASSPLDRPEFAVGAAFAGGLVLAKLFKRLGR